MTALTQFIRVGTLDIARVVESEGPFAALDFLLPGFTTDALEAATWLKPRFIDPVDNRVIMSFHSFVIRAPNHTILVDACTGNDKERPLRPNWHRQQRPFLDTLTAAGVHPDEIDMVFCTHLHADHVGWNTVLRDGRWVPTFRNAKYLFAQTEYHYWERQHRIAVAAGTDAPNHGSFGDSVLPVVDAGQAVFVTAEHELDHGLHLEAAQGHTPGACILHAASADSHAVFTGDTFHTPAQFVAPDISSRFCVDPVASAKFRRTLCDRYADTPTRILAAHFPTPTAGRICRHDNVFRFDCDTP